MLGVLGCVRNNGVHMLLGPACMRSWAAYERELGSIRARVLKLCATARHVSRSCVNMRVDPRAQAQQQGDAADTTLSQHAGEGQHFTYAADPVDAHATSTRLHDTTDFKTSL